LTYLEVGAPDGAVVMHHHGGLVSASDIIPLDEVARRAGVRWVSFDRPGIAGSTPMPGRTLLDGARDAEQLLDHLGVGRARVSGWSMGGPYALATVLHLGDRVPRAAVIAGSLPLNDPDTLAELNAMDRRFTSMARSHRSALRTTASVWGDIAAFSPRTWAALVSRGAGPLDEMAVRRVAHELAGSAADSVSQPDGLVEEYVAWARPWDFALGDIATPVDVWQGTEDHLVPVEWSRRMAAALPEGDLHVIEGEGHFLLLNHADDVLVSVLGDGGH